jgi:membrane protein DedA with SNARE-associated domain
MDELLRLLSRYGYTILFFNLLLESIGLPIPAGPILVAAGAASAFGTLQLGLVVVISLLGMILGDWLLYVAGRYSGWALLGFLCRLSANPETCVLTSAQLFYKRGRVALLFSKFLPGINTMAAPMAGSLNMRSSQFLGLDVLGTMLYTFPFIAFGYFFSHLVSAITDWLYSLSLGLELLGLLLLVAYLIYRLRNYWKNRLYRAVPQVTVDLLAERLSSKEAGERVLIVDARSHGYYDAGAMRIKGSSRIEPNNLTAEMEKLPKNKDIYIYCT